VALTRARDTLILTGSVTEKKWETLWAEAGAITRPKILAAKSYADWLGIWFAQQSGASSAMAGELPDLRWRIAEDAELASKGGEALNELILVGGQDGSRGPSPYQLEPLDDDTMRKLRETLSWQYGFSAATERAAKSSVTVLRRQVADELDDEAEPAFSIQFSGKRRARTRTPPDQNPKLSAADAGTAHHKFLQHVSLAEVGEAAALAAEAGRLEQEKVLSADERAVLDLPAVAAFWNSDVGQKIRRHAANVKRELAFTAKFSPAEVDEILGKSSGANLENEFVVVQGVADLVVALSEEIWLVDFKTDAVHAADLPVKLKAYKPQLKLYASALGRIYCKPVTNCWLHFLSAQQTARIDCSD
jgi:ATP-dependent helicase/nuclease subunit A